MRPRLHVVVILALIVSTAGFAKKSAPTRKKKWRRPGAGRTSAVGGLVDGLRRLSNAMTGGGGGPPYLSRDQRQNSMVEQKVLFSRAPFGARSDSFSAPAGSNEGFRFDDHFNWQGKLGSGSYSELLSSVQPAACKNEV